MSKHIALKSLALFISWLTLSPLLLILDGRWKLLSKRLRKLFFFFSPLMLIVYMAILIACYLFYGEFFSVRYFVKPKVVENITGDFRSEDVFSAMDYDNYNQY